MNSVFAIFGIFGEWIEGVYLMSRDTIYDIADVRRRYVRDPQIEGWSYYVHIFIHSLYLILKSLFFILALTITCSIFLLFLTLIVMLKVAVYTVIATLGLLFLFAGLS